MATKKEILQERDLILGRFKSVLHQMGKKLCNGELVSSEQLREMFQETYGEDIFLGFIEKVKYTYEDGSSYKPYVKVTYKFISNNYFNVDGYLIGEFGLRNLQGKFNSKELIVVDFYIEEKL